MHDSFANPPALSDARAAGPANPHPIGRVRSVVCDRCGYNLAGQASTGPGSRCPECGVDFAQVPPRLGLHPPRVLRFLLRATTPLAGLALLVFALSRVEAGRMLLFLGWGCVAIFWAVLMFCVPVWTAVDHVARPGLATRSRRSALTLALVGVAVNLLVTIAAFAIMAMTA